LQIGDAPLRTRLGVNPTGTNDHGSTETAWSAWVDTNGTWQQLIVTACVATDRATLFVETDQDIQNEWNVSAVDRVEVRHDVAWTTACGS
jgi:hypothetical protein